MISNIRLQQFRSYNDQSFEFEDGVNIIVGPNASGKTNLLEAISMTCRGKSFRSKDIDTIMFNKEWGRIDAYISDAARSLKLLSENGAASKEFMVGDKSLKRLTRQHIVPVVVFEPNHLLLLHGSPEGRRVFLDGLIEHLNIAYPKLLTDYKKTLAQRNSLLKSGRRDDHQMFVWNIRLSEQADKIVASRQDLIDRINKVISRSYSGIAGSAHDVRFTYTTKCAKSHYGSSMLKQLEENETTDYQRGFTGVGPHRDDIEIRINGKDSSLAASRGEARTMLLALKMFELEILEEFVEAKPILLLDDVFSELDGQRRKSLTDYLNTYQSFITTTDADILSHKLVESAHTILFP